MTTVNLKKIAASIAAVAMLATFTACEDDDTSRDAKQKSVTLKDSLEIKNLETKLKRENDPNAVRYVYLISFAQPIGYYVIKGKVSSSGSQLAPEDEIIDRYEGDLAVDSAQDDGTYGTGDPGIFFFTADGTMVSTTLDYIESDAPLPIDVPRLGGEK